ncbi:GIY-YIG nuclease family protein [Bacillus sp. Brlt_9]|uniref:GIY-YIG nuclease family protein n=1 Tax=Bacillus sp. Brlt_9 TaxID=3110916 RepID=UPI003F7B776F
MIIISAWTRKLNVNYIRTDLYVWERRLLKKFKESGVYVFRDKNDKIIYIGEAQNLAERVSIHLTGKDDGSALYAEEGFTFTYKVELYRLTKLNAHMRFFMEIDGIQRSNPTFNKEYRLDGTPESRAEQREDYIKTNEDISWRNWTYWQVQAFLSGDVLTDVIIEKIKRATEEDWDNVETKKVIKKIKNRLRYPNDEYVIEQVFLFGTGILADKNQISPVHSMVLAPDIEFKTKFKKGAKRRVLQMISNKNKKGVGESLAPTERTEGDKHKISLEQVF